VRIIPPLVFHTRSAHVQLTHSHIFWPMWVPPIKEWEVQHFFSHAALLQALTVQ